MQGFPEWWEAGETDIRHKCKEIVRRVGVWGILNLCIVKATISYEMF